MNVICKGLSRTYIYIILFSVILFSCEIKASSSYVIFPYEGYRNAANMDLVENFSATLMGSFVNFNNKYNGTQVGSVLRSSKGNKNYVTPMGDIQWRAMPKLVLGLYVYDPMLGLIQYKSGNQAGTKSILNAKSYSPKISYQVLDNLTLGAGIDFMHLSKAILAIPGIAGGTLVAKGDSFKTSFNVGALFKAQPTTLISASFHKGVNFKPKGNISLNGQTNKGYLNTPLIPDIYSANLTQILTPEWLVSVTARFLNWKPFKTVTIYNAPVVGNLVLPQKYHSAGYGQLLTRYQFSEQ